MRNRAGAVALVCALGAPAVARAQAPSVAPPSAALLHLDYVRSFAARQCLAPDRLMRAVEERLGRRVFVAAGAADLDAKLRADRSAGGFQLDLELFDRQRRSLGRRQLRSRARHCSALDDSLALVVSLAADVSAAPAPGPAPAPGLASELLSPIEIPANTPAERAPWRLRPSLGVAGLGGLLPLFGWGPSVELELTSPRFWPLFVRATGWLTQRIGSGATGARFKAQSLELGVCPGTFPVGPLESRWCVEQLIAPVQARGIGFDEEQRGDGVALALGPQSRWSIRFGDWFISVSGSLLVPLVRRRYFYDFNGDDSEVTLHDQGWVWGAASLSVGIEP